eukprot:SAG11_NODE_407_length_9712_cov_11.569437_3_plen_618_part_00
MGDEARERGMLHQLLTLGLSRFVQGLPNWPTLIDDGTHYNIGGVSSPEYPAQWNRNCSVHAVTVNCTNTNFGIALVKWSVSTLLAIIEKHQISDPLTAKYKDIEARLYPLSVDETGYMVDWKHDLDMPHRHWSHLLGIYDLAIVPLDGLAARSLDRWTGSTGNDTIPCPTHCRGFTRGLTGILSALLGRGDAAAGNLSKMVDPVVGTTSPGVTCSGGPCESYQISPCPESAYVGSGILHEMLLHAVGDVVTVFPAVPDESEAWQELSFYRLRSLKGLLVSAVRRGGKTSFVSLEAAVTGTFLIQAWQGAAPSTLPPSFAVKHLNNGTLLTLRKGQNVTLYVGATPPSLKVDVVADQDSEYERFGFMTASTCMSLQCAPYWPFIGPKDQCIMPPNVHRPAAKSDDDNVAEPIYHFWPTTSQSQDPSGVLQTADGRWHVFPDCAGAPFNFSAQPISSGLMWCHFSSWDLVHWTEHPPALVPSSASASVDVFTGSIVDLRNGHYAIFATANRSSHNTTTATGAFTFCTGNIAAAISHDPLLENWTQLGTIINNDAYKNPAVGANFCSLQDPTTPWLGECTNGAGQCWNVVLGSGNNNVSHAEYGNLGLLYRTTSSSDLQN